MGSGAGSAVEGSEKSPLPYGRGPAAGQNPLPYGRGSMDRLAVLRAGWLPERSPPLRSGFRGVVSRTAVG